MREERRWRRVSGMAFDSTSIFHFDRDRGLEERAYAVKRSESRCTILEVCHSIWSKPFCEVSVCATLPDSQVKLAVRNTPKYV